MKRRHERGLGTLAMCAVLLAVLALGAVWAARQLSTAQRVAANDFREAAATEATESGMAWALAMLNGGAIDDTCRPATVPSAPAGGSAPDFRGRFLQVGADGYYRAPAGGTDAGSPSGSGSASGPIPPACINASPLRWTCRCSASAGSPPDPARLDGEAQPQFSLRFVDAGPQGQVKLIVRGCSDRRPDCDDLTEGPVGVAESAQHLALLSALRVPPTEALVEGPGSFVRVFGFPPARYREQPALVRLGCTDDCTGALAQALARGRHLIWIDGNARLSQWPDTALDGTPFVLIVDGRLDLSAAGHPQGVLYARDGIDWHLPPDASASLRGAVISDGHITRDGPVALIHDPAVLYRIHRRMGSFLPVPGGWTPTR